jgi:hypothetical protein
MDNIFFTPNINKPVKLVIENNIISTKTEKYKLTIKEVLKDELKCNYKLRRNLTRQQIHTEYGKIHRGYYSEVINFLVKRGITKEYLENEINQERERCVFTRKMSFPLDILNCKFGVYELK